MKYFLSKIEEGAELNLMKASLLQKLIRRGMVEEALYISKLYIDANQSKGLRRRLQIIAAEDIGLAWPQATQFIEENEDLLLITQSLCFAPKNRESDRFLLAVAMNKPKLLNLNDKQVNFEVRVLLRLFQLSTDWFNNKKDKQKLKALENAFEKMSENLKFGNVIKILGKNYIELTRQKVHGARCQMALAALIFSRKWEKEFNYVPFKELKFQPKEFDEIFDFAIDMHTPIGKKLGLDFEHWIKNCVTVKPEVFYDELLDIDGKEKYPLTKESKF